MPQFFYSGEFFDRNSCGTPAGNLKLYAQLVFSAKDSVQQSYLTGTNLQSPKNRRRSILEG